MTEDIFRWAQKWKLVSVRPGESASDSFWLDLKECLDVLAAMLPIIIYLMWKAVTQ